MSSTSERSDSTDTLPRPELNPLLNPILSDNMGRWAEVYFTSPPEKREEAVLELLHELESEKDNEKKKAESQPAAREASLTNLVRPVRVERKKIWEHESEPRLCAACGSENPLTHQFCGMCGAKLPQDSSLPESDLRDPAPLRIRFAPERTREREPEEPYEQGPYAEARVPKHDPSFYAPAAGSDELSLFQSFRSPEPEEDWDYEPPSSSSYRFYIAAVLLVVIGALGYMAWRGSQTVQSSHEVSPPPAPVTESAQPADPAQQPSNAAQATAPAEQTAPPKSAPEAVPTTPASENAVSPAKNRAAEREVAEGAPLPAAEEHAAPAQVSSSGGVEELAMAERYLNGSVGRGRNSGEAATWLWKSVAKHNGQATMLLADLYLRGDGVPKNCEQGRVLLDSAAQKGVPGAGYRLRNLQAFGCH